MVINEERRESSRIPINLPMEYRFPSSLCIHAAMVVNAGEDGLLMESNKQIPIGAILNITVLFPERKELASIFELDF